MFERKEKENQFEEDFEEDTDEEKETASNTSRKKSGVGEQTPQTQTHGGGTGRSSTTPPQKKK